MDHSSIGNSAFDIGCSLEGKSAYTYIGPERESLDALNREVEAALSLGLPADFVDRAPVPFATGGAVRFTDQAQFNPTAYPVGLAQAVADVGGAIYEKTRVIDLGDVAGQFQELEAWARSHFKLGKAVWRWSNEDYDTAARVPFVGAPAGNGEGLYIATGFKAWGHQQRHRRRPVGCR